MWYRITNTTWATLAGKADYEFLLAVNYDGPGVIRYTAFQPDGNNHITVITPSVANDTNWHHVAYTANYGAPVFRIYVDGVLATNTSVFSGTERNLANPVLFGDGYLLGLPTHALPGDIDEIRVSDVARSAGWIKTSYNNQKNPAAFVGFDREEYIRYKGTIITIR